MLLLVSSIKLVAEIALLALAGQFVLGRLVGPQREANAVYQLLRTLTRPFVWLAGRVLPAARRERHAGWLTAVLLALLWLAATVAKVKVCLAIGMQACR